MYHLLLNPKTAIICRATFGVLLATILITGTASAQNKWTGNGGNENWSNEINWSAGHVPEVNEEVIIDKSNAKVVLEEATPMLASLTIENSSLLFTNWATVLNAGEVHIKSTGKLILANGFANNTVSNRIAINCDTLTLDEGGEINANEKGFAGFNGPGTSPAGSTDSTGGASHGGVGGYSTTGNKPGTVIYGSVAEPETPGSGAGKNGTDTVGKAGGGVIRIDATGRVAINGTVTANGQAGHSASLARHTGGGSGGSILIKCQTFAGKTGKITANGGTAGYATGYGNAGGGGGGRIALHYNTVEQALLEQPTVQFSANPGWTPIEGYNVPPLNMADWGTLYFSDASGVFKPAETISNFCGHISIPGGIGDIELDSLTVTNAFIGFLGDTVSFNVSGPVELAPNSGIIGRTPTTFSCQSLNVCSLFSTAHHGAFRFATNTTIEINQNLIVSNALFALGGNSVLIIDGDWLTTGSEKTISQLAATDAEIGGNLVVSNRAVLEVFSGPTNQTTETWGSKVSVDGDIIVTKQGWIYPYSDPINGGSVTFFCSNLLIEADSGINANSKGFVYNTGPGCGPQGSNPQHPTGGAGHGGKGGISSQPVNGGIAYGNALFPIHPGSGARSTSSVVGGLGGGLIRVVASKNVVINGKLMANGGNGVKSNVPRPSGGGSGGSIFIVSYNFSGDANGLLSANGGNGAIYSESSVGGGGGGGRIAIWIYCTPERFAQAEANPSMVTRLQSLGGFSGTAAVTAGTGWEDGEPGTIEFISCIPQGTIFKLH